jgi:iron complex transport system permease protein
MTTAPAGKSGVPSALPPRIGPTALLGVLAGAALVAFTASLALGPTGLGLPGDAEAARLILWEIRVPRAVLGALVGAALGLTGAALQGYLRNPLAEPSLVGVSGGAALGAVLAIQLGLSQKLPLTLPVGGLAGAAVALLAVVALAGAHGGPVTLILAGLAVSGIATALISLVLNLSQNPFASVEMVFWLMGSLADRSLPQVWLAAPLMLAGMALLLFLGRALDALSLGEDAARSLGIDVGRTRLALVAGTALAVGAATSVTGVIGFVGLLVPHVLRPFAGHRPSLLLPASALGGAIFLLVADIALRLAPTWMDLRVGVLTALIGAPFFVWLVLKTRSELAP